MKKRVIWFSEKVEHQKLASKIDGVEFIKLPESPLKKIVKIVSTIKTSNNIHIIIPSNIEITLFAPLIKLLKGISFDIFVDEIDREKIVLSFLNDRVGLFARKIILPSKQMKHSLKGSLKKSVVIPPSIHTKNRVKKTELKREYKIVTFEKTASKLDFDERFIKVDKIADADAIFFSYPSRYFQYRLDRDIFDAIETGKPVFIEYPGAKTVNKLFSEVKSVIYVDKQMSLNEVELQIIHAKEMKIPKKYSFTYNLAKIKKILKEFIE